MKPNESCDQEAVIRQVPQPACARLVNAGASVKTLCHPLVADIASGHPTSPGRQARDASVKKITTAFEN